MEQSTSLDPSRDLDPIESSVAQPESVTSREICTNTTDTNILNSDITSSKPEIPSPFEIGSLLSSREICTNTTDANVINLDILSPNSEVPTPFEISSFLSQHNSECVVNTAVNTSKTSIPLFVVNGPSPVIVQQPLKSRVYSDLPSPASVIHGQPQTLFVQALAKLNENSLSMAVMNHYRSIQLGAPNASSPTIIKTEISPPDSLSSAPPSYSFVLRQMAVRRRPRIVGTFIPSPSFIQHTPPPNYTAAFDIYVENPLPPPPTRVYHFGFTSMPVVCPDCGYAGMSLVHSKVTLCTHLCAIMLCILCCWVCAPLPYMLRSCKDVYHYCRNCRHLLGMYCPTSPENGI